MKKFLSFALAAIFAVVFSAFTTTRSESRPDGLWYEDPDVTGVFHVYTESTQPCLEGDEMQCTVPVAEEGGRPCKIFYDNEGLDPYRYQPTN